MPNVREPLKIIKVPLGYKPQFRPNNFNSMPRLYLELLENKNKVKPELRNREYIPKIIDNLPSVQYASSIIEKEEKEELEKNENFTRKSFEKEYFKDENRYSSKDDERISLKSVLDGKSSNRNNDDIDSKTLDLSVSDKNYIKLRGIDLLNSKEKEDISSSSKKENDLLNMLKTGSVKDQDSSSKQTTQTIPISQPSIPTSFKEENKDNLTYNTSNQPRMPPSLQEIGEGKVPITNNSYHEVNITKNDENEIQRRRDILHKFKYLKRYYPEVSVPEFSEYTDIKTLESEYNALVKTLKIDSNVENYKKYLSIGFFGLEFFLSRVLKFQEIKGFSSAQMLNMNQYEKILLEIGEKSYLPEDKQLAPEIRLVGIILMNAAIFIGTKMVFKSTGMGDGLGNIMNMMNNLNNPSTNKNTSNTNSNTNSNNNSNNNTNNVKKRTMRGPDISDLEDIVNKKNS